LLQNLPIHLLKKYSLLPFLLLAAINSNAQFFISGNVYDSSKTIPVKNVLVKNLAGDITKTDSTGHYRILVKDNDSLLFIYNNKSTEPFAVNQIRSLNDFNISLHIHINEKFKTLKEVRVYSKTYREDSIENRDEYAKDFDFEKPGIGSNMSSYSGAAGLDLDEFINMFKFRKNKLEASFQRRLIEEEQDKYVSYRFNKWLVRRITRIEDPELDIFMKIYRPSFEFTEQSNTVEFYQYILNASYQFKQQMQLQKITNQQNN
jgi:hypothetical protein